jgi:hypothetical protein
MDATERHAWLSREVVDNSVGKLCNARSRPVSAGFLGICSAFAQDTCSPLKNALK